MLALKQELKELKKNMTKKDFVHFKVNEEFEAQVISPGHTRDYIPVPTLKKLHQELGKHTVALVIGPYGSGKSVGENWQALFCAAKMMAPCKDGVRRSKAVFIRNTYDELKQTTYEMWLSWFSELGSVHATLKPLEVKIKFNDEDGPIELFIQFLSLDKPQQYRKLRSSFFTWAYINEVSESPEGIISQVLGRTGRYPSMDLIDISKVKTWYKREALIDGEWTWVKLPYWSGVIADSNPPEVDSEIYKLFETKRPRGYKLFKQPPGLIKTSKGWELNRGAENLERLGLTYYPQQAYGATEEYIRVFCCGEYGTIKTGELIYEDYNDNIHAEENLATLEEVGLRLSFDTWYTPACNISQYATQQLRVLAALWEEHIGMDAFVNEIIKPYLHDNFNGLEVVSVSMDPAGLAGTNVHGVVSDYQILKRAFGGIVKEAPTNKIKPRLAGVQHMLKRMTKGKPSIVIDKERCDVLRKGFLKHYVWRESRSTGEVIYEPNKNKYSHNQDALQYEVLSILPQADEFRASKATGTVLRPLHNVQRSDYYAGY